MTSAAGISPPLKRFLDRLHGVRRSGKGFVARCPAHDDRQASLSISEGDDGRVLVKCHAGCDFEEIVRATGLEGKDMFPQRSSNGRARAPLTVAALAESKRLPVPFLKALGLVENGHYVKIPYRLADATEAPRSRQRSSTSAKTGSRWYGEEEDGAIIPYGLWKLEEARKAGFLILVEGESDAWTLWYHGFPTLGIPGASMTGKLQAPHLDSIPLVYIVKEPDKGGKTFVRGLHRRLKALGFEGRPRVVLMQPEAKDPNALHKKLVEDSGAFTKHFQALLDQAEPMEDQAAPEDHDDAEDDDRAARREEAPDLAWVPFPTAMLPPDVRAYVVAAARALLCEEAMIAVPGLAVLAAAVGNTFRLQAKQAWEEPATLWTLVIAQSGSKKSPAMAKAVAPVYSLERRAKEDYDQRKADYDDNQELPKDKRLDVPKPTQRRYRVADVTLEGVARVHSENPRGLLLARDEGAGWIGSFDRYAQGEADLQGWNEQYDGRLLQVDRKSSDHVLYITNPAVSVATTIQPRIADDRFTSKLFVSGFVPRIIMTEPPEHERTWTDADITEPVRRAYFDLIEKLYGLEMTGDDPRLLGMEPEARSLYKRFYNDNAALMQLLPDCSLRSAFSKIEALPLRLALSLYLADCVAQEASPNAVTAGAMERALTIARWIRYEASRVYLKHGWLELRTTADEALLIKLPDPFTVADVARERGVKRRAAFDVIKRLLKTNVIEKIDARGQYKPQSTLHSLHSLHSLQFLYKLVQSGQFLECSEI